MAKGKVWSTKKINEEIRKLESGLPTDSSAFYEGNPELKAANIVFEYTKEELEELTKCANDVVYFANRFCYSMTDEGVQQITLRPYQENMLEDFQDNRFVVMLASRQIGKTVTSSIFIAWYLCFHYDRNVMIVANKMATTTEIVDKVKVIIKNLPFFIKPGVTTSGATGMKFDNGCRLYSQATTKTAAIGFTIHLLYADEFAHIHPNFLTQFYRSIYPTLSSSKISRIIISSTPNGMNLFYELYTGALEGKNSYHPIRVDWWQVPGRDEKWKQQEIGNLGSEELFNQEYGNQFLASSRLLLPGSVLEYLNRISKKYVYKEHDAFFSDPEFYKDVTWHPDFDPASVEKGEKFVLAVDIGDGVGRDFSIINIFKMEPQSKAMIRKVRDWRDETGFFRLRQVGLFRSNTVSVEDLSRVLETLMFEVFESEDVKTVMEINFKGNLVFERVGRNRNFFPETFLHTKHSISAPILKPGVKMQKDNKEIFCRELRGLVSMKKILITEERTVVELASFGINSTGSYSSQIGNDDVAMSCVNMVSLFDTTDFYDMVEDIYDEIDETVKREIDKTIEAGGGADEMPDGFQLLKDLDSSVADSVRDMAEQIKAQQKLQIKRGTKSVGGGFGGF
jgi:hypothetical protein